jgi:hypothetical protein
MPSPSNILTQFVLSDQAFAHEDQVDKKLEDAWCKVYAGAVLPELIRRLVEYETAETKTRGSLVIIGRAHTRRVTLESFNHPRDRVPREHGGQEPLAKAASA